MADWMEELERLAELRDKGLITDEEFEAEKKNILPAKSNKTDNTSEITVNQKSTPKTPSNGNIENSDDDTDAQQEIDEQEYVVIFLTPIPRAKQPDELKSLLSARNLDTLLIENAPSIPRSLRNLSKRDSFDLKDAFEKVGGTLCVITSQEFMQSAFFDNFKHNEFVFASQRINVLAELQKRKLITKQEFQATASIIDPKLAPKTKQKISIKDLDKNTPINVELTNPGPHRHDVRRVIQELKLVDEKEAKKLIRNSPTLILKGTPKADAEIAINRLEDAGASVTISISTGTFEEFIFEPLEEAPEHVRAGGHRPNLKCQHCDKTGFCYQIDRTKMRQDETRRGRFFSSRTWQEETNIYCGNCGLNSTIKGSSHYGF